MEAIYLRTRSLLLAGILILAGVSLASATPDYYPDYYEAQNERIARDYYLLPLDEPFSAFLPAEERAASMSPETRLVVNLPSRRLTRLENGVPKKVYPVTIGQVRYKTPISSRQLSAVTWNPWWYPPDSPWAKDSKDTPPGPGNPLGKVKMFLGGAILLHGTSNPWSIGRAASHACMRLYNRDVRELAEWLQETYSDQATNARLQHHMKSWSRQSYTVQLNQTIPFDIVYRTIELDGDTVVFHPDIYLYRPDYYTELTEALAKIGIPASEIDLDRLPEQLPQHKSLRIPLASILYGPIATLASIGPLQNPPETSNPSN